MNGAPQWKFKAGVSVYSTPVYKDSTLYVGSSNGTFYAVDTLYGREKWRFRAYSNFPNAESKVSMVWRERFFSA